MIKLIRRQSVVERQYVMGILVCIVGLVIVVAVIVAVAVVAASVARLPKEDEDQA